jgi:hypothetical protein
VGGRHGSSSQDMAAAGTQTDRLVQHLRVWVQTVWLQSKKHVPGPIPGADNQLTCFLRCYMCESKLTSKQTSYVPMGPATCSSNRVQPTGSPGT